VRYFPAEIDGIADFGVHALAACRTMNVGRIANEESAPHPEFLSNAMVDAIGREPIHLRHFHIKKWLNLGADIFKGEVFAM
jgi:hypothetical protein